MDKLCTGKAVRAKTNIQKTPPKNPGYKNQIKTKGLKIQKEKKTVSKKSKIL